MDLVCFEALKAQNKKKVSEKMGHVSNQFHLSKQIHNVKSTICLWNLWKADEKWIMCLIPRFDSLKSTTSVNERLAQILEEKATGNSPKIGSKG